MHFGHEFNKNIVSFSVNYMKGFLMLICLITGEVFLDRSLVRWCLPSFSRVKLLFPLVVDKHICDFKPGSMPVRVLKFWTGEIVPLLPTFL